ncbi:MAG: peptidase S9 [Bacteroidetes bacterium]|nr:MAG: peptidase S9 [Bacteroidota bacterium]
MKTRLLAGLLVLLSLQTQAQKKKYGSLPEALYAGTSLRGDRGPSGLQWIDEGCDYSFTKQEKGNQQIWTYDIGKEAEHLVFSSADHSFPGTEEAFHYRSFAWTRDYKYLLFQTNFSPIWRHSGNADYYYYSIEDKSMRPIVKQAFTAEVSPDGKKVGYGKDGDLFVFDLATGRHSQLTHDGAKDFYNGRFGWANEEEFGLVQAWSWSHDSRYIAFWQTDEREVPVYKLTDFSGQHPEYTELPYPKVGDPAPIERLGVLNIEDGTRQWLDLDPEGGYMPRIYWTSRPDVLAVVWMNRAQNHLKLYLFNLKTGDRKVILEEKHEQWIDIFDFFAGEMHLFYFPEDMDSWFWLSDRNGYTHIYRYDYNGELIQQVTSGDYDVVGIKAINPDKKSIYYLSTEVSPMDRKLYRIKFNGKGKTLLTPEEGNHRVNVAPGGSCFVDSWSSTTTPRTIVLRNSKGGAIDTLAGHEGALKHMQEFDYAGRELFSFTTSDGQPIDGYLIKPMDFDPDKSYPLVLAVYGGPGSQGVYNSFETSGWKQYLAQKGFVVANINNRGNGGYGSAFEKLVHKQLGKWETHDFAEAALHLAKKDWIDGERVAIMGHSYGGFSAGTALLQHGDVFKAGIVTAAISDHRNYDCVLTEKYMGLLHENEEGYRQSSMVAQAKNLESALLLVHSLMDDNVHPQNTFQFTRALLDAGKEFDLKIFPPGNHGVAYDMGSQILLYQAYLDFLLKHLEPDSH